MIFKYCVWPDSAKQSPDSAKVLNVDGPVIIKPASARKFTESLIGCCPCAFRCRRPIGVDSPVLENGNDAAHLPVFALTLNGGSDTVYDMPMNIYAGWGDKVDPFANNHHHHHQQQQLNPTINGITGSTNLELAPSPLSSSRHGDADEARSRHGSGSSLSSNRSATNVHLLRGSGSAGNRPPTAALPAHTESDESDNKAFDVISLKSHPSRRLTPDVSAISNLNPDCDRPTSSSDEPTAPAINHPNPPKSPSTDSISDHASIDSIEATNLPRSKSTQSIPKSIKSNQSRQPSLDSLIDPKPTSNGYEKSISRPVSATRPVTPASSTVDEVRAANDSAEEEEEEEEPSEAEEEEEEEEVDVAFETLDYRNGRTAEAVSITSIVVASSPVRSKASTAELRSAESKVSVYSCNSVDMSPKSRGASPKRFVSADSVSKGSDTSGDSETPPLRIGFDGDDQVSSLDGSDEVDDVGVKPQPSQRSLATPIDLPKKLVKVSPCKMRPRANCHRAVSVPAGRHVEKSSKAVQQCFAQLESKDWEVTLKGLKTLSLMARDEPELLDVCAPGLVARLLGKQVKNLRSQVARVACSAAGDIFSSHIRGIDQDLDEIAGPLLHRTADTNRFLREDCNRALDIMIEHMPPQRTILTIANRGASHQNTIVHATTARLLFIIVSDIGPEHVMILPRDVRDKLLATVAKLLTDGNLQARKHAKETFRLLCPYDGFRKALTEAVPETTLRLIDKTLRSL